jgi:hypothetical protein
MKRFFITGSSFHSIEINGHQLKYLLLLVIERALPEESFQICLFYSQGCESTFHSARTMSGAVSSIINFSVPQFLRREQKLSVLNRVKSDGEINSSGDTTSLSFPQYDKQGSEATAATDSSKTPALTKDKVKQIVSVTFYDAFALFVNLCVHMVLRTRIVYKNINARSPGASVDCKSVSEVKDDERSFEKSIDEESCAR